MGRYGKIESFIKKIYDGHPASVGHHFHTRKFTVADKMDARSNTISPAEYLKLTDALLRSQREIDVAAAELAAAKAVQNGIYRRAKNQGADVEAIKHLQMLAKMDDDSRNHLLENVNKYADWTGVKLWVLPTEGVPQGALFAGDPEALQAAEQLQDTRVSVDAANSRRHGGGIDSNPHAAGSRDHQTWAQSWKIVDAEMTAKPPKVELASTERRGRGRPKKVEAEVEVEVQAPRPAGRLKKLPPALIETRPETVRATIAADDAAEKEPVPTAEPIATADVVHFPDPVAGWNN
jgi:uncharacterized protein (UPF0335 family)